ncbi:MAG: Tex family protein [Sutterella sp.]|nr:Tex family protein [Sutterella sp.]
MDKTEQKIFKMIAGDIGAGSAQVEAAVRLLDDGATVPFIARYRKEVTGSLDDTQLRQLEERLIYLRELEERRQVVLGAVRDQGKLTPDLEQALLEADSKQRLEDLYLPYRPKRRTRAAIAREAGLEPLAKTLLANPTLNPEREAQGFLCAERGVVDVKAALDGARDIIAEIMSEAPDLVESLRNRLWREGAVVSRVVEGQEGPGSKFRDYFEYSEPVSRMPSHRALAIFRGRSEGVLNVSLETANDKSELENAIADYFHVGNAGRAADAWLMQCCRWTWRVKLAASLEADVFEKLREQSENAAIDVFGANLRDLLLASPAGHKRVIGLDPGIRTGIKLAVIDATGKLLDTGVIFPFEPFRRREEAISKLAALIQRHRVELAAIGNGTASRETAALVEELASRYPALSFARVVVSEAGASVYSASELAAQEFPDLDVSYRGAISIARRLQDPLAELVKIDPKAIGVGQYQHDVNQSLLARRLDAVVEDCVNAVGVDVNTASVALLSRVAGLTPSRAAAIVQYRSDKGAFRTRRDLLEVPRLGAKTFEQAAGFLRIPGASDPLDASAVHPEAYPVVKRIAQKTGISISSLIGNSSVLRKLRPSDFTDGTFGIPTVTDILTELEKPGRDPRPEFKTAQFADGIHDISDLQPGMRLEGVITNVAAFGAFVDVGVHQDGLIHISCLSDRRVDDPRKVVKVGDIVKVRVLDVDVNRRRISLTMRTSDGRSHPLESKRDNGRLQPRSAPQGAMAAAFAKLHR